MTRIGQGQWVRPATAAGAWRGLALELANAWTYDDTTTDPIPFDTVVSDTDSISDGLGGGIIPAGMLTRWRLSGLVFSASGTGELGSLGVCYVEQIRAASQWRTWQLFPQIDLGTLVYSVMFAFSPIIVTDIEEADLFRVVAISATGSVDAQPFVSWFTMEYIP